MVSELARRNDWPVYFGQKFCKKVIFPFVFTLGVEFQLFNSTSPGTPLRVDFPLGALVTWSPSHHLSSLTINGVSLLYQIEERLPTLRLSRGFSSFLYQRDNSEKHNFQGICIITYCDLFSVKLLNFANSLFPNKHFLSSTSTINSPGTFGYFCSWFSTIFIIARIYV